MTGFANNNLIIEKSNEPWLRMFVKVTSIVAIIICRRQLEFGQKCAFRRTDSLTFNKGKPERDFAFWNFVKSG